MNNEKKLQWKENKEERRSNVTLKIKNRNEEAQATSNKRKKRWKHIKPGT